MRKSFLFIFIFLPFFWNTARSQEVEPIEIGFVQRETKVKPGEIVNLAYFFQNKGTEKVSFTAKILAPRGWKIISNSSASDLNPTAKKLVIFTLQVPSAFPVGEQEIGVLAIDAENMDTLGRKRTDIDVQKIESIQLLYVNAPAYVTAGERFQSELLLKNHGNTIGKVFVETVNCDVEGTSEIEIAPGETKRFKVYNNTNPELNEVLKAYYSVRANLSGETQSNIYRSYLVFPQRGQKRDPFFRFPVSASATYLSSNQNDKVENAYQFQVSGSGMLDPEGKHRLEFLARGPNNTDLSFLGLYDQYYVSYENKNAEVFVGEKSFSFTPLTESARFGMGTENRVILNNGLNFGFLYVKPRYYEEIENEMAGFLGFEFNPNNEIKFMYISKASSFSPDIAHLGSLTAQVQPFKKTSLDLEFSRGEFQNKADNAMRANMNTQFSVFQLAGTYYYTGKYYPGYYNNSKFYSGNLTANISKKVSLSLYAKEDFRNAALDTFFVTSPYSRTYQTLMSYNIAKRAYLKFYWRNYERKDRLESNKFHYQTNSLNAQFSHRVKKIEYNLLGELGKTTNFLLAPGENEQNTFRGTANFGYRFNSRHSVRAFGSWSNVNSFVSGDQRNVTAGFSAMSQITPNLNANFHIQNAYDIDDYYRNRNLMQLNIDYRFLQHHKISLRSFYTIFKQTVGDPEFTASVSYIYDFGVPLKRMIRGGDLSGNISYENGEPAEGIILNLQNKTAATDNKGNYLFETVEPGRHLLYVEREKMEIDQLTNIPSPIQVEIIEDQLSTLNFAITKGAKLVGKLNLSTDNATLLNSNDKNAGNIIVELKNEFEQFRITTDKNGDFSFPMIRPGPWTFKIYANSIPEGFQLSKSVYQLDFESGETKELFVELKAKTRKIIFKSQNTLTPLKSGSDLKPHKKVAEDKKDEPTINTEKGFYTVQIGAFKNPLHVNSDYLKGEKFDFEMQIDNFYKYFIGRFPTKDQAQSERHRLLGKFNNAFVVFIEDNKLEQTK